MEGEGLESIGAAPDFYFSVKFSGLSAMESAFQEVSGLKVTVGGVEKEEGGENSFRHFVLAPPKFDNLVLKRCLTPNANLIQWVQDALERFQFNPHDLQIALKGANGKILVSWNVVGAYPVSWELATLNSTSNALAIETLTLTYRLLKREE